MKVIGFMVDFLKIIKLWDLSIEFYMVSGNFLPLTILRTQYLKPHPLQNLYSKLRMQIPANTCSSMLNGLINVTNFSSTLISALYNYKLVSLFLAPAMRVMVSLAWPDPTRKEGSAFVSTPHR